MRSPLVPWRHTIAVVATLLVAVVPGAVVAGAAGAIAAGAGYQIGSFASLNRGYKQTVWASAVVLPFAGLVLAVDGLTVAAAAMVLLTALAAREYVKEGSRVFVVGLLSFLMMRVGVAEGGGLTMLAIYVGGVVLGAAVVALLGLTGSSPPRSSSLAGGVAIAVFLVVGLAVSELLVAVLAEPRGYWIAIIFTGRALAPFENYRINTVRYGVGALAGVAAATGVALISLPYLANLAVSVGAFVAGVRTLTHRWPLAPGFLTLGVLLSIPGPRDVLAFRAQAIAIVVVLAVLLSFAIEWLWATMQRRFPDTTWFQPTAHVRGYRPAPGHTARGAAIPRMHGRAATAARIAAECWE